MEKKKLLPHQQEAVDAVINQFKTADRTHIVMACGTGKTFTALNIVETLNPKCVIVFLPSLALINQFMKEWLSDTSMGLIQTLTVCSDDTVAKGIETDAVICEKINFPVTIDPGRIERFVKKPFVATKLIFCTYHSSHLLAEGAIGHEFDLAIFDEAHKTAGIDKKFSCALHDNFIKIKKRLFMTATPRHAHAVFKDEEGKPVVVYSMDDESIYGPRCYTLGFRDAINKGLICDYKIIISVADEVCDEDAYKDNIYAGTIALKKAIASSGTKRVITYHGSIQKAKDFCDYAKTKIKGFTIGHINGDMSVGSRNKVMTQFKESPKSIICNARCLTEGVDVPAVDMVAFLNPRSSTIDIVQAIGRALRKYPGKDRGYVFLPIFLNNSIQDASSAIQGSEFSHIWDVLNILSEQDTDLNDVIKKIGRRRGSKWSDDEQKLNDHVTIDDRLDINFLESIRARILDRLCGTWDINYKHLCEYKKIHGEVRVIAKGEHKSLGLWVKKQRALHAQGQLDADRKAALDSLGFIWSVNKSSWDENFRKLKEIVAERGGFNINKSDSVYDWYTEQNRYFNNGTLKEERKKLLQQINFPFWKPKETLDWFERGYPLLLKYLKEKGIESCPQHAPISTKKNRSLRTFVEGARLKFRQNKLTKQQLKLLDKIHFPFEPITFTQDKT